MVNNETPTSDAVVQQPPATSPSSSSTPPTTPTNKVSATADAIETSSSSLPCTPPMASAAAAASYAATPAALPQPVEHRRCDGHIVYPVWRAIRELEADGKPATATNIAAHFAEHIQQFNSNSFDRALDAMCEDNLLMVKNEADDEDDDDDEEAANDADMEDTFELPLATAVVGPSSAARNNGAGRHSSAGSSAATSADDIASVDGVRLRASCRISVTRDCYCYECHRAGPVLACAECHRSFHVQCVRSSDQLDVPLLRLRDPIPDKVENTFQQTFDCAYTSVKRQAPVLAELARTDPLALRLCVRCRLLKRNAQHLRPLTPVAELHELLRMSFRRIREWIAKDTFSSQEPKSLNIPTTYVRLLTPVLFAAPLTADEVMARIASHHYRSLVEYLCDIMDVLHCLGVLRGTRFSEYEAAKYMQLDAVHDITEMARCQDCYLRSGRQRSDTLWFVRPCTVPHRIVYAKVPGFSYWPAKVIRQKHGGGTVSGSGGSGGAYFDVRFFGKDHTRAMVAERFVVPDGRPLQLKQTAGLKRALAELKQHKELLAEQAAANAVGGGGGVGSNGVGVGALVDCEQLVKQAAVKKPATAPKTKSSAAVATKTPKAKAPSSKAAAAKSEQSTALVVKRGRGRPRKESSVSASTATFSKSAQKPTPKPAPKSTPKPAADVAIRADKSTAIAVTSTTKRAAATRQQPRRSAATATGSCVDAENSDEDGAPVPAKRSRSALKIVAHAASAADDDNSNESIDLTAADHGDDPVPDAALTATNNGEVAAVDPLSPQPHDDDEADDDKWPEEEGEGDEVEEAVHSETSDHDDDEMDVVDGATTTAKMATVVLSPGSTVSDRSSTAISRLRRQLIDCPPQFVGVAIDALRDELAYSDELRAQNEELRSQNEKKTAMYKRSNWCNVCLKPGTYHCCSRVSYCSAQCQATDWQEHHDRCLRE